MAHKSSKHLSQEPGRFFWNLLQKANQRAVDLDNDVTPDCNYLFSLFFSGWYVVWQLFLSKFKFLRELVGDASTPQAETEPSEKSKRPANAAQRPRPRTARQRVVSLDDTS